MSSKRPHCWQNRSSLPPPISTDSDLRCAAHVLYLWLYVPSLLRLTPQDGTCATAHRDDLGAGQRHEPTWRLAFTITVPVAIAWDRQIEISCVWGGRGAQ